jgi:hypothetical protein
MKPKLLLGLALVVGGGLVGCSNKTRQIADTGDTVAKPLPQAVQGEMWNKTILTNWTDTKVTLYRALGEVVQLNAKKSIYQIWTTNNWAGNHSSLNVGVVAFIDPQNGMAWLGNAELDKGDKVSDFYVEDESGIFSGRNYLFAGEWRWNGSLIAKAGPGEDVGTIINQFEQNINGSRMLEIGNGITFSPRFRDCYFYPHVYASNPGATPVDHVEVADGKLRLEFTSPAYQTKGSVWMDLKTRKVLEAVEYK